MGGATKGLNNMEFGIGDIVRIKPGAVSEKYVGAIGIIREQENVPWTLNTCYTIEMPKSVIDNSLVLDSGIRINGMCVDDEDLELVLNKDMRSTKESEQLLTALVNQRVNNKYNTWEVRIRPSTNDKDATYAELYINDRFEGAEYVNRYHKDKYSAGMACIEACKKLFGVKDVEKKSEEIPTPKYYTGKVICTGNSRFFTKGKIYKVENGTIHLDDGAEFVKFKSFEELSTYSLFVNAKFIEFVE